MHLFIFTGSKKKADGDRDDVYRFDGDTDEDHIDETDAEEDMDIEGRLAPFYCVK